MIARFNSALCYNWERKRVLWWAIGPARSLQILRARSWRTIAHWREMASSEVLDLVRSLRAEAGPDFDAALSTAATLLENILEHPAEEKYRTVRKSNAAFQRRLGRFPSGLALLRAVGFEDATQVEDATQDPEAAAPTHLALPNADAAALAHAFVVLRAAQEAAQQVDGGGGKFCRFFSRYSGTQSVPVT